MVLHCVCSFVHYNIIRAESMVLCLPLQISYFVLRIEYDYHYLMLLASWSCFCVEIKKKIGIFLCWELRWQLCCWLVLSIYQIFIVIYCWHGRVGGKQCSGGGVLPCQLHNQLCHSLIRLLLVHQSTAQH